MEKIKTATRSPVRDRLCRVCFLFVFLSLVYAGISHTLVSQLKMPALQFPGDDLTYWVFDLLSIPKFISGNFMPALFFDILLLASCVLTIVWPAARIWPRIFFIFYFVYFIIYSNYGMHHVHSRIGILLISFPFVIPGTEGFLLVWQGLRYYTCFIYVNAFCWKLVRGSWLFSQQGVLLIKRNLTPYLYFNPGSRMAGVYHFVLQHPAIAEIGVKAGFFAEGFFLVGFFTSRFDKYLLMLAILLPLGFLFMADALFFEVAFLSIVFYKSRKTALPSVKDHP